MFVRAARTMSFLFIRLEPGAGRLGHFTFTSVIGSRLVASRGAPSTIRQLRVVDFDFPPLWSEGDGVAHVKWPGRGVDFVTRPTGPAAPRLIHMNMVEIAIFVPELRHPDRLFGDDKSLDVTVKT
jgi:hypothetical protein